MTTPAFLLFGANGDLALRMLWPSLFRLHCDTSLPKSMAVYGISRSGSTQELHEQLRKSLIDEVNESNCEKFEDFLAKTAFFTLDAGNSQDYQALAAFLAKKKQYVALAYLSMPPDLFTPIAENLHHA